MGGFDVQALEDFGQTGVIDAEGEVGHEQGVIGRGPNIKVSWVNGREKARGYKPGGLVGLVSGGARGAGLAGSAGLGSSFTTSGGSFSSLGLGSPPPGASTVGATASSCGSSSVPIVRKKSIYKGGV